MKKLLFIFCLFSAAYGQGIQVPVLGGSGILGITGNGSSSTPYVFGITGTPAQEAYVDGTGNLTLSPYHLWVQNRFPSGLDTYDSVITNTFRNSRLVSYVAANTLASSGVNQSYGGGFVSSGRATVSGVSKYYAYICYTKPLNVGSNPLNQYVWEHKNGDSLWVQDMILNSQGMLAVTIGVTAPGLVATTNGVTVTGYSIFNSPIKIADGTQCLGCTYTSDFTGNAAWQTPNVTTVNTTSSGTFAISSTTVGTIFFIGSTSTFTLPSIASSSGLTITVKNKGSGNITLSAGAGSIYTTTTVSSVTVIPGATWIGENDGVNWSQFQNN